MLHHILIQLSLYNTNLQLFGLVGCEPMGIIATNTPAKDPRVKPQTVIFRPWIFPQIKETGYNALISERKR